VARIVVSEAAPAVLMAGGPLKNTVSATRRGPILFLKYELIGAGGEVYTRNTVNRSAPPEFVAYQAGRKVGTGKFEFG
jgi:hypothetical protein